jgi:CRP-like cAMP-binding protein
MHHRTCAAMGLVETMALSLVAALLRAVTLEKSPPTYRLKMAVKPLPAPDRYFRMRVRPREQIASQPPADALLREEVFLATFEGADKLEVSEAFQEGETISVAAGTDIIRQGDEADAFYIVLSGRVEVFSTDAQGDRVDLAVLTSGDYFGEIGLLLNSRRNATVRALPGSEVKVLRLGAETFRALVAESDMVSSEIARVARKRAAQASLQTLVADAAEADLRVGFRSSTARSSAQARRSCAKAICRIASTSS